MSGAHNRLHNVVKSQTGIILTNSMIAQWYTIGGNYHFCIIDFIFFENNDLFDSC